MGDAGTGERCSTQLDGIPGLEWRQGHQKLELTVCLETALGLGDSAWQHRVAWRCQRGWPGQCRTWGRTSSAAHMLALQALFSREKVKI